MTRSLVFGLLAFTVFLFYLTPSWYLISPDKDYSFPLNYLQNLLYKHRLAPSTIPVGLTNKIHSSETVFVGLCFYVKEMLPQVCIPPTKCSFEAPFLVINDSFYLSTIPAGSFMGYPVSVCYYVSPYEWYYNLSFYSKFIHADFADVYTVNEIYSRGLPGSYYLYEFYEDRGSYRMYKIWHKEDGSYQYSKRRVYDTPPDIVLSFDNNYVVSCTSSDCIEVKSIEQFSGVCGDGICGPTESASSCPSDCIFLAGDGKCEVFKGENYSVSPNDCLYTCGDSVCSPAENVQICPSDCNAASTQPSVTCGDGICSLPVENVKNCPKDCSDICGDNICSGPENALSCPQDCPSRYSWFDRILSLSLFLFFGCAAIVSSEVRV